MNISLFANKPFEPGFFKPVLSRPVGAKYATGDLWRKNSRKNEDTEPMQNQYPVVHVTGDRNKVWCFKEQYCIGTWNVRSMNEGKLQVMKQETVRVIIYILGISQLKWTGMGEFNSDDHDIYYCGQEFLRSNGVAIMVNKGVQYAVLGCNLKNDRMISVCPRQTIQYHSNPSLCTSRNAEEAEVEWFYEEPQDLLELTAKKISFSL